MTKFPAALLAPTCHPTIKAESLSTNSTKSAHAATVAKHLVARLTKSAHATVVAKALVASFAKRNVLAVIAKDLFALLALCAAITAKVLFADRALPTRLAVVARYGSAH